jgi:hypothetical protein
MSTPADSISLPRLLIKALVLFLLANLLLAALNPMPALGEISLYNRLFPGRIRLPYGEKPDQAYNLSLFPGGYVRFTRDRRAQAGDEYRVVLLGDSSVWGFLLPPEETLSAKLNDAGMKASDGRDMCFYNLAYPTLSLAKDLMLLERALEYQPDLIIWPVTLESMPLESSSITARAANSQPCSR